MSRLVVVSNRVGPVKDTARAGGLAVALVDALKARGGIWYGWSGRTDPSADTRIAMQSTGNLTRATLDLTEADYQDYYNGFANRCLWPLFHYRLDLTHFDRRYYDGYLRVNAKFARGLYPLLQGGDLVWVHDYHFLALGNELRRMGASQPIGYFLHIPFPSREVLATLPNADMLVRGLFACDVVGFQTTADVERFQEYVIHEADGIVDGERLTAYGRTIVARAFPIGIDTAGFARMAATAREARSQCDRMRAVLRDRIQIIGVDRLDYTKGLPERFQAFEHMLETYPDTHGRVVYMQIAPPSREQVAEYIQIRRELESLSGHINGRFSEFDWMPLRYINRAFGRRPLAGLYRASKIGLVTPLRDGMNLVAKEYVAAQDPEDPGVLVLSRFAGAAGQMREAMVVNPYDTQGVADALQQARFMPLEERRERHHALMQGLLREDVAWWRDQFLDVLSRVEGGRG